MVRRSTPMSGQLRDAAAYHGLLDEGLVQRHVAESDAELLGRLMAEGYRGTVDDTGEDDTWHHAEAVATLRGHYGPCSGMPALSPLTVRSSRERAW